jgi:hypothetical protein
VCCWRWKEKYRVEVAAAFGFPQCIAKGKYMTSHKVLTNILLCYCVMQLALLVGCGSTTQIRQPVSSVYLADIPDKIDFPLELVISEKLKNEKWERTSLGQTAIVFVGETLAHNAKRLAANVFTRIYLRDGSEPTNPDWPSNRLILEPQLAFINQSFGATTGSEAKTTIGLEWTMRNNRGDSVWVETIQGEGVGIGGSPFSYADKTKERVQRALEDLFKNSQASMLKSQALRKMR